MLDVGALLVFSRPLGANDRVGWEHVALTSPRYGPQVCSFLCVPIFAPLNQECVGHKATLGLACLLFMKKKSFRKYTKSTLNGARDLHNTANSKNGRRFNGVSPQAFKFL